MTDTYIKSVCPECGVSISHYRLNKVVFCSGHLFNNPWLLKELKLEISSKKTSYVCPWCSFDNIEAKEIQKKAYTIRDLEPGTVGRVVGYNSLLLNCSRCGNHSVIPATMLNTIHPRMISIWQEREGIELLE